METIFEWGHTQNVAFGVLTNAFADSRRRREVTFTTTRSIALHNPRARFATLLGASLDALIASAYEAGFANLLVFEIGSYLRDADMFVTSVASTMDRNVLAVAHLLNHNDSYFEISTRCIYLNLALWACIGKPSFGSAIPGPIRLQTPCLVHKQTGNPCLPPISSSGQYRDFSMLRPGWNLIHMGLEAHARIIPFSQEAIQSLGYIDAEGDDYILHFNDWQQTALDWLERCWFVNTEPLIPPVGTVRPIRHLVALASGLKPNVILETCGWVEATQVIYYDSNRGALHFKRWLLDHWNGCDYVDAVRRWCAIRQDAAPLSGKIDEELEDAVAHVHAAVGGRTAFQRHWSSYRRLRHSFLRVNLHTSDMRTVVAQIDPSSSNTVIWWSNVFHSVWTQVFRTEEQSYETFDRWINLLRERSQTAFVLGSDHLGRDVSGPITSIKYYAPTGDLHK